MTDVPGEPRLTFSEHREAIERKLKQIENAYNEESVSAASFVLMADEAVGVLMACVDDIARAKERVTYLRR